MNKINFKELEVSNNISWTNTKKIDVREQFANLIYTNSNGIRAHSLAHKIYESDGDIEIDDEDLNLIKETANNLCTPIFIDAINKGIKTDK
jgi:hypothetical protein